MTPQRFRRSRKKGYRQPDGAVYVGRGTPFGNPWRVSDDLSAADAVANFREWICSAVSTPEHAAQHAKARAAIPNLRGRNLLCWCRLDAPCHADVLLELANG